MKKNYNLIASLLFLSLVSCDLNITDKESNEKESESISISEKTSESGSISEGGSESESSSGIDAYKVEFDCDDHVKVYVYSSQDYTIEPIAATYAYSLDSTNFEYTKDEGQINFKVVFDDGYSLDSMVANDTNCYKNIKTQEDNIYRVTKISGDFTLSITSKQAETISAFKVTFECDEHVKVYVYSSQDYNIDPEFSTYAYSLDKESFQYTKVEGQVNFKVVFDEGYELNTMTASEKNYKNLKGEEETLVANVYRITKISGDFILVITSKEK